MKQKWAVLLLWIGVVLFLPANNGDEMEPTGGGIVIQLPDNVPLVALTFDDGPNPVTTPRLLEGLALREVPATFFVVGSHVEEYPELVLNMRDAGHQIGVHTYDHVELTKLTEKIYEQQVRRNREQLTMLLGEGEYWLRPPYGLTDGNITRWEKGPLIIWSVDPEDWKDRNSARVVEQVVARAKDGDIILLHDIYEESVDAALAIVDELLSRGFCFVTVEQLASLRGGEIEGGLRYTKFPPVPGE